MRVMRGLDLIGDTTEEALPDFSADFPCATTRAELHRYPGGLLPWHWHGAAELFFIEEGELEYCLPRGTMRFPRGSGGLLLPGVLHKTTWAGPGPVVQLLHLFDPAFLFGGHETRMGRKYLLPLLGEGAAPLLPLDPGEPEQAEALARLRASFDLDESAWGFEADLRQALCDSWLFFARLPRGGMDGDPGGAEAVKQMIAFIQRNLSEPLDAEAIARAAHVSPRTCYRLFRETLRMTPNEYVQASRVRRASALLARREGSVTEVALACGFESASYFGRVFRKMTGKTPVEFQNWQKNAKG